MNDDQPTFYVTGASGCIGANVVTQLCAAGRDVVVLARDVNAAKKRLPQSPLTFKNFDLSNEAIDLDVKPNSVLIHCAWQNVREPSYLSHLEEAVGQHYSFIKEMANKGVTKIIVTGTFSEFGLQYGAMRAEDKTDPNTPYAVAKDHLHKALRCLEEMSNFELIWLRLFYVYGDGQDDKTVISQFDKALREKDESFPMSQGEQLLDYLPVEDVAKKILLSVRNTGGIYHVCSGEPISLRRLLERRMIEKNASIKLDLGAYPQREEDSVAIWGAVDDLVLD